MFSATRAGCSGLNPALGGRRRARPGPAFALFLSRLLLLLSLFSVQGSALADVTISSARVWPAEDYTRLTLESASPIHYKFFTVKDPERLVLDLEDVDLNSALKGLAAKVSSEDPYIKLVRVGRFKPGVLRLVVDLKTEVAPSVFVLKPYGEYGYRLVLDIYPEKPVDPLMALVQGRGAKGGRGQKGTGAPAGELALRGAKALKQAPQKTEHGPAGEDKSAPPVVDRLITIAIDAGHGGEDPGARGKDGTEEKNVTLAIARRLKAVIDEQPNMRGVLIRNGDYFIPLHQRIVKARKMRADLFVSIHADAYDKSHARGSSVFALSERGATSAAARWLAKKENDADLMGGVNLDVKDPYLARTLLDLSQTATINDSLKLGKAVLSQIGDINPLHRGTVEQAGFAVLKSPDIPSILVETAFISNPEEERKLTNPAFQEEMADSIAAGIKRYLAKNPSLAKSKLAQK